MSDKLSTDAAFEATKDLVERMDNAIEKLGIVQHTLGDDWYSASQAVHEAYDRGLKDGLKLAAFASEMRALRTKLDGVSTQIEGLLHQVGEEPFGEE